ncbi:MAG TPA: hypothetical protein VED01_14200 [Burkholderiales bacterium]|nr:hypothetical protein [Burkholderiales bacterium]
MKRSNHGTRLEEEAKHKKPPEPAAQTGKNEKDARGDDQQLAENQEELRVGDDHKTPAMERGGRGTFP